MFKEYYSLQNSKFRKQNRSSRKIKSKFASYFTLQNAVSSLTLKCKKASIRKWFIDYFGWLWCLYTGKPSNNKLSSNKKFHITFFNDLKLLFYINALVKYWLYPVFSRKKPVCLPIDLFSYLKERLKFSFNELFLQLALHF